MTSAITAISKITEHLTRVRCNNPSIMTGTGTNTYVVHNAQEAWVIDPGPADAEHVENIFKACDGLIISKVFVTHMHPDHSPAHKPIIEKTGAVLLGCKPVQDPYQDETCVPSIIVEHEEWFELGAGIGLRAFHTPGHVDNHVCYQLEPANIVMTGDHIMQGSTVVIIPPHGKMKAYIESLQLLLNYPIHALAPGHGEIITDAKQEIEGLIKHRLQREKTVIAGLEKVMPCDTKTLVKIVYSGIDENLLPMAELSLLSHLIKLESEKKANCVNDLWSFEK